IFILSYALSLYFLYKIVIKNIKFLDVIKASIISWFLFNTMPFGFITGDAAKIIYISKKYKKKISHLVVPTTLQRIVSTTVFIMIFFVSIMYTYLHYKNVGNNTFFTFTIIVALTMLSIVVFSSEKLLEKFLRSIRFVKEKHIKDILLSVKQAKKHKKNIVIASFFSTIHWISGIFIPYVFLLSFGVKISIPLLAVAYIFYSFIDNMPAVLPSNIGIHESAMTAAFILVGIDKNIAATVTLLVRVITVVFEIGFTGIISYFLGIKEIKSYLRVKETNSSI
ncbi:MAG: flippase-like domain-containing protein, partial [Candidatus Aenigmarchaeota archaeon]|nr:flippase-like domain-containing protein [Candidatus Aenigmarchaeota archaeon]